jgi:hypothetical protein
MFSWASRPVSVLLLALLMALPCPAAPNIKLYMKDGSYQLVSSYEVKGDRVRYYSVERSEWEEVPLSLVDFDATKRAQEEEKATDKKELQEARDLERERFEKPVNTGFEVAPGVHLPQSDGIYTFDGLRVIHLLQSSAEVVTDKKRAALVLAMPLPVLKSRSLVTLQGEKAAIRLTNPQPAFYVQASDGLGAKVVLIRVKSGKEARIIEQVEAGRMGIGKPTELRSAIPVEREQLSPEVYKLKPAQALDPGEYALAELIQDKQLNLELWDFGVDKPEEPKSTK